MKKTILIGLLLILVGAMQAQVTIWEKYYRTTYNQEMGKYDTVGVLAYPTQFHKGEIDSITMLVSPKFTIEEKKLQLRFGAQYTLHYSIFPEREPITWTSGDPFVARVTDGVITTFGKGETTITGTTKDGTTQSVVVKVSEIPITINVPSTVLRQGESMQISATIEAESEQTRNCIWSWKPEKRASLYLGRTLYGNTCGPLILTATADTTDAQGRYMWRDSVWLDVIAPDQDSVPPYAMLDSIRKEYGHHTVLLCVHCDQLSLGGSFMCMGNEKSTSLNMVDELQYPGWKYVIIQKEGVSSGGAFIQYIMKGKKIIVESIGDSTTWRHMGGCTAEFVKSEDHVSCFVFHNTGAYIYRYKDKTSSAQYRASSLTTSPLSTPATGTIIPRQVSNPETGEIDGKIQLWKDGQQVQWPYGYVYDHTISNLDSISLIHYTTKNIQLLDTNVDTVYLQNKAYGSARSYSSPLLWEPYYSLDTFEIKISNPGALSSPRVIPKQLYGRFSIANQLYSDYEKSYGTFSYIPAKAGQTDVTIRSGKVQTQKRIVVIEQDNTIYATSDSLLQMIYNRMTITGSIMPDGACDIPGIDEGTTSFYRMMWELNEFPADHIWWIWNDVGLADLRTHNWSTNNDLIRGLYARLYRNIDFCNQYLELTQTNVSKKSERAEVKFMRAFYYSYLLDLFGNVPIITQHVLKDFPTQSTRKQVFQFVIEELEQAAKDLPEPGYRATNYRVDKAAAWLLLSRVYLNSEVYCGLSYMDKAAEYAYKVIKCPYKLSSNYQNLFMGDNNERYFNVGNDAVQEIILSIDQNPQTVYCWGGSRFLICAHRDAYMPYCGVNDTWSCIRSKTNLVEAFTTLQKASSIWASNTAKDLGDDRGIFCSINNSGKKWGLRGDMAADFYACWAITKYTNLGASSSYTPGDENRPDMDIPIMRKAEAYLTYAEAVLRGGTVQSGYTALSAVNELRTRAHAAQFETISLAELLNEWAREFYAEGRRRMDLIRFGMFSGQNTYNWEGKNGKNCTTATTIDAHYNLYPIPQNMVDWNPNLKQNPGY